MPPSLSVNDLIVTEGNSGSVFAAFGVSLSATNAQTVSVSYTTSNGTATAGIDYVAKSGLLTFVPGETLKPITVTIKGDTMAEATETLFVNLTNPTNAILSQGTGVASILNDDSRSLQIGRLANHVLLSWSTNSEGFGLLAASAVMPSPAWFGVTNPVTISSGYFTVTDDATNQLRIYRLHNP